MCIRDRLRGDSGFSKPELYEQCETNGVSYVIRLKENKTLCELASDIDECLTEATKNDMVSYAVSYTHLDVYKRQKLRCSVSTKSVIRSSFFHISNRLKQKSKHLLPTEPISEMKYEK